MSLSKRLIILAIFCTPIWASRALAEDPLTAQQFAQLHKLIKPQADEWKWAKVPWASSLGEARARAAAEGKPIFLWQMSGEPLGQC
jgi:hypothetical protein